MLRLGASSQRCQRQSFAEHVGRNLGKEQALRRRSWQRAARRSMPCAEAGAHSGALPASKVSAIVVGYLVLLGACFRNVPQIVRIAKSRSSQGVSLFAYYSELVAYTIIVAYNLRLGYPFSTYGDTTICWLQDIALIGLMWHTRGESTSRSAVLTLAFAVFCWLVMSQYISMTALTGLMASTIPIISLGGRVPQIILNWRRGNTGELSLTTCTLNVMGCAARIFTTSVMTQDVVNLLQAWVQLALNGILFYQTALTALQARQQGLPGDSVAATP